MEPIHKWLEKSGRLIYSDDGQFRRELGHTAKQKLQGYVQAGVAKGIPSSSFHAIEANYQSNKNVKSDDAHILALAKHTGARLLFTEDKNLIEDFKNKDLINKPRGKFTKTKNMLTYFQMMRTNRGFDEIRVKIWHQHSSNTVSHIRLLRILKSSNTV